MNVQEKIKINREIKAGNILALKEVWIEILRLEKIIRDHQNKLDQLVKIIRDEK